MQHHYDNLFKLTMERHKQEPDSRKRNLLLQLALKIVRTRRAFLAAILLLAVFSTISAAQDEKKDLEKKEIVVVKEVVKPEARLTKNIIFVLDVSGSMNQEGKIEKLMGFVQSVMNQPLDDMTVAIFAFNDGCYRWDGVKDPPEDKKPCPAGWAKLPSETALKEAQKWLSQFKGSGGTAPEHTMTVALLEKISDMSVILVTDGDYNHGPAQLAGMVDCVQKRRADNGLGEAVIMTYGVGKDAADQKHLADMGKKWKGGFYVDDNPAPVMQKLTTTIAPIVTIQPFRRFR